MRARARREREEKEREERGRRRRLNNPVWENIRADIEVGDQGDIRGSGKIEMAFLATS